MGDFSRLSTGFDAVCLLFESNLKCKSNEVRNNKNISERISEKCMCPLTNWSQSENIIDKFLFLNRAEEARVYKTSARDFKFSFVFKIWPFMFTNRAFFRKKGSKIWGAGDRQSKIPSIVLETRCWWAAVQSSGACQLPTLEIILQERTKIIVRETANFPYNFVQKTNATEQLGWHFWPTLPMIFVTQFSPVDLFKIELYKETKKSFSSKMQFWPYIHAEQHFGSYSSSSKKKTLLQRYFHHNACHRSRWLQRGRSIVSGGDTVIGFCAIV